MSFRTLMAGFVAVFLLAASQPAWAYRETQPGDEEWPEIPGRMGMKAFLGTWSPECDNGAVQKAGKMTVLEGGQFSYDKETVMPLRYRVIEETPHYVVTLVQYSGGYLDFWAFRPLGKSYRPRGWTEMTTIGIDECPIYGDEARKQAIWDFSDTELVEFWKTNKFCHPSLTEKARISPYWGGDWGQACYYAR